MEKQLPRIITKWRKMENIKTGSSSNQAQKYRRFQLVFKLRDQIFIRTILKDAQVVLKKFKFCLELRFLS